MILVHTYGPYTEKFSYIYNTDQFKSLSAASSVCMQSNTKRGKSDDG
jgi:hypothetical protein